MPSIERKSLRKQHWEKYTNGQLNLRVYNNMNIDSDLRAVKWVPSMLVCVYVSSFESVLLFPHN